jgi:biotin carboxylase
MTESSPLTLLCLGSELKGLELLKEAKRQGCRVLLVTKKRLEHDDWPRESIDEIFVMNDGDLQNQHHMINAISYLNRSRAIDQIVPLDEYDVEMASLLREHLGLPGMRHTDARYFRDKLSMRMRTQEAGLPVPPFVGVLNYDRLREYMGRVRPPWMFKPRLWAGAIGMKKLNHSEEMWRLLDTLGDEQSQYVMEQFIPGEVFHVDSIVADGEVVFASVQQYGRPPMIVAHEGGVFITRIMLRESAEARALQELNRRLIDAMPMERGITHAEYIKADADGSFYFLEVAARVGGANIPELIEAATGINLWREWARLEVAALRGEPYKLPPPRQDYAGIMISLAKQEYPDTSAYNDPEVVWRMHKKYHAGLIVASPNPQRVDELLNAYSQRFYDDFVVVHPQWERPPD